MRHAEPLAESRAATSLAESYQGPAEPPMETCDEGEDLALAPRECPLDLLGSFSLLMAAQGRPVSTTRMLTDRNHAMWQLARARTCEDEELRRIAARLFAWFDERDQPV